MSAELFSVFLFWVSFCHLVTKKNKIQCTTHTKDSCGRNAPKLPDLEEYFSEIIIFKQ
jgi:hypothetical protein